MSIPAATATTTVLADHALLRTSLAPKLILPLSDGSGATAADVAASPENGTYIGSPDLTNATPAYGNPDGTTGMELVQGGAAICRLSTAGKLAHLVDGTLSHTTLIVVRSTDAANPNPFNYPVALGFANNFGTYDNMVQMCLNGKADGSPNGGFACYRWYSAANGSTAAEFNHGGSIFDGEPHTVAFVYSTAASGTLKIYVDGVLGTNATGVNAKAPVLQTYFGIGTMVANNGTSLDRATANIEMSDFQYFETELTAAQIAGWHARAINGEVSRANADRRVLALHAIDSTYGYDGGVDENAVITAGTLLPTPVLSLHTFDNSSNDPTYGLTFNTNAATLGTSVANALIEAYDLGKPCIISFNKLLCQSCTMNAVSQGFSSQPTPTSLLTGLKARKFITTDEAARIAPWCAAFLARLSATGNSALRFNAGWSNTEELPVSDLTYNQPPGTYRDNLIAFRTAALADSTIAARVAALIDDGAADDETALDYLIHEAAIAAARELLDTTLGAVPLGFYFMGKNAIPMYQFRNGNGTPNTAGLAVASLEIGSWAYQNNPTVGETALLIEDISLKGTILTIPLLDIRYAGNVGDKAELETRLNACRDRGLNDVVIFGNQMAAGAGTDLTNASSILAAAQGARMSVPVIQSASLSMWAVGDGTMRLTTEWSVPVDFNAASNPGDIIAWHYGYKRNLYTSTSPTGDGTTTMVFYVDVQDNGSNAPSVSFVSGVVTATTGAEPNDTITEFPSTLSGIVSAVFDEAALTLTITFAEPVDGDTPSVSFKSLAGVGYTSTTAVGNGTPDGSIKIFIDLVEDTVSDAVGTMTLGAASFDDQNFGMPNIALSNYPITEIPAGGGWLPNGDNGRTHRLGRMNRGRST